MGHGRDWTCADGARIPAALQGLPRGYRRQGWGGGVRGHSCPGPVSYDGPDWRVSATGALSKERGQRAEGGLERPHPQKNGCILRTPKGRGRNGGECGGVGGGDAHPGGSGTAVLPTALAVDGIVYGGAVF